MLSVYVVVSGAKFSLEKVYHHYENGCFLSQQAPKKVKKGYKNIDNTLKTIVRIY